MHRKKNTIHNVASPFKYFLRIVSIPVGLSERINPYYY